MDPISQGVLGASVPQAISRKTHLAAATLFGALAGLFLFHLPFSDESKDGQWDDCHTNNSSHNIKSTFMLITIMDVQAIRIIASILRPWPAKGSRAASGAGAMSVVAIAIFPPTIDCVIIHKRATSNMRAAFTFPAVGWIPFFQSPV